MRLRSLAQGGVLGFASLFVEKGATMALIVVLARMLGGVDYGRYSFVVAYLTIFQVLADFGVEPIALRRLCQEPERRADLMANLLGLRLALAGVAAILAIATAPLFRPGQPGLGGLIALGTLGVLFPAQTGFRSLFRSALRLDEVLRVTLVASLVMLALVALVLWLGLGVGAVFLALAVANAVGFLVAALLARPLFRLRLAAELATWRAILLEAWPIGANVLLVTITLRLGPILLMAFRGPEEVGYFASASKLIEGVNLLSEATMLTLFPLLAAYAVSRPADFRGLSSLTARYLAVVVLVVVLVVGEVAPLVLSWIFRPEFARAAPAMELLTWWSLFATLGLLYTNVLVALGMQRTLLWLNCGTSLVLVALEVPLVARFGMSGAAVAVVVAGAVGHAVLCVLPATATWIRPCVRAALWPAAIALALRMVVAPWLPFGPILRAIVLAGGFAAVLLGSGLVGQRDMRHLRGLMRDLDADAGAAGPARAPLGPIVIE